MDTSATINVAWLQLQNHWYLVFSAAHIYTAV